MPTSDRFPAATEEIPLLRAPASDPHACVEFR
ncbi:hypothetical protein ABH935_007080 [Catenulispora sp. GAS73]